MSRRYLWMRVLKDWRLYVAGKTVRVPVSRCHRNKRIGECVCSISIQFKRLWVLNFRKSRISRKLSLRRDCWFYLFRTKVMVISIKKGLVRKRKPSLHAAAFATVIIWSFQERSEPKVIFCHGIPMSSIQRKCQEGYYIL